jgi:membrane protein CcdC involved in cytochrome C biogenesis
VRFCIGVLGVLALLAGLWAGLILLKVDVPNVRPHFEDIHGPLMVFGFFGTLISLERAVALGNRVGYIAPASAGIGGIALVVGLPLIVGQIFLAVAGIGLLGLYLAAARRQASLHLTVMGTGAIAWVVAVIAWIVGRDIALLVPFLAAFLILTIAGERLELARVIKVAKRARAFFVVSVGIFVSGVALSLDNVSFGVRTAGLGLICLAVWLAKNDVARRTVRGCALVAVWQPN